MPHRKGSFHEDWSELLERFAHRGTPAAIEDQIRDARDSGSLTTQSVSDVHRALFELSDSH
ncbi:MAG TPA: hypothetical protein VFP53_09795 [Sphingomicrobium sp.]|nr:hypothetical protein [Sphingomicrobium sp.]